MRRTLRVAVLSVWAGAVMVAAQAGVLAGSAQTLGTPTYESCPAKISQVHNAASYTWDAAFKCKVPVSATIGGVSTSTTGTITASYSQWTTSTADPCPSNFSFTPTITLDYSDRSGTIHFSAPMEVLGNTSGSSSGTQTWCYSEYNVSYGRAVEVTGTGAYAAFNEMCGFELGARTDARGGQLYFSVDDQYGQSAPCYPYA